VPEESVEFLAAAAPFNRFYRQCSGGPPLCITQNSHRLSTLDRILVGYRQLSQSHVHAILVSKFKQSRRI